MHVVTGPVEVALKMLTLLLSTAQLSNKLYFSASDAILNFDFFPFFF